VILFYQRLNCLQRRERELVNEGKIKAHLEYKDFKVDMEGGPDEVFHAVVDFLSRVFPNLEVVSKVTFTVDLMKLMEDVSQIVKIAPEGPILIPGIKLTAGDAIISSLVAAYIGYKLKKLPEPFLSIQELSKIVDKAVKTIRNEMVGALREGIVKKAGRGRYQITDVGIAHFQGSIMPRLKALKEERMVG